MKLFGWQFQFPDFLRLGSLWELVYLKNGEELCGPDRYLVCCGDRIDKRGVELTGLLNQIKLAILFIFD